MKRAGLLRALLVPTLVVGLLTPITAQQASAVAMRKVTLAKTSVDGGLGSVTVTDGTTTAVCDEACQGGTWSFPRLNVIRFTQTARASDSNFSRWTVGGSTTTCPATGSSATCSFTLSADTTVSATFSLNVFAVSVGRTLSGAATTAAGTVAATSQPSTATRPTGTAQINCGTVCSAGYLQGATVTLTATPASSAYAFVGWSGTGSASACTGNGTCVFTVTLAGASTVTANFLRTYSLNVTKATGTGIGSGAVTSTSSPSQVNQIDCGSTCSRLFNQGTTVTLNAAPSAGSAFGSWSGCTSSSGTVCTVTIDAIKNVSVTFLVTYGLSVARSGNGSGSVTATSSPTQSAQINCGATCTVPYSHGMAVTLNASPATGSVFTSWSGVTCSQGTQTGTSCTVSMTEAQSATATFTLATHSLSVATNGGNATGGSVTAAGISCPADCSEVLNWGTVVNLTAVPGTGMDFTGWTGCTSTGALTCALTISGATSVVASFTWQRNPLALTVSGSGSGTVRSGEATPSLDCTDDCSVDYDYSTNVTLTATADPGSRFMGWTGACAGTGSCVVSMSEARSVTATFTKTYMLQMTAAPSNGAGSVSSTSSPTQAGQIACGVICSQAFLENASVTLTAAPGEGSYVTWSGCSSASGNTCQVAMAEAKTVTATFTLYRYRLSVAFSGQGSGEVTGSVGSLSCTANCWVEYDHFTVVTLSASANAGSRFMGWSGEGCSGTGTCQVTMVQARSVTATFANELSLTVTRPASNGSGSVSSTVDAGHPQSAQISCGSSCSQAFLHNAVVTLAAAPDSGSYVTWGGACIEATGDTCDVTMTEALSVSATFTLTRHALGVAVSGNGSVASASQPDQVDQIACGLDCAATYDYGTLVTLTAHPAIGWETTWSGACSGTTGDECTDVSMTQSRSATATFTRINYGLTADLAGNGTGTVSSTSVPTQSSQVTCTADCTVNFPFETVVTLTAAPDAASSFFAGWSPNCTVVDEAAPDVCVTTVLSAKTVVATFTLITRTVTVGFDGAGSGSVVSDETAPEIDCASTDTGPCSAGYDHGSTPALTATAAPGSRFTGWAGDCSGTSACDLDVTDDLSVTADFAREFEVTVTLDAASNGSGSVISVVDDLHAQTDQIDCAAVVCGVAFLDGATVTLTAHASPGSYVTWGADCLGTTGDSCTLEIDGAGYDVTARFTLERYALTVTKQGNGSGTVSSVSAPSQSDQIDCGSVCTSTYDYGTVVTLTPLVASGSTFTGWQGGGCSGTGPCEVTISQTTEVKAYFMVLRTLTVTRSGNGASYGRITSTPPGLDCQASTCTATFVHGTSLSLAASSATGATFTSWGGDGTCSGGTTPCTFTINADTGVSAAFTLDVHTVTLNISGNGSGSVAISTGSPSNCSSAQCVLRFDYGTAVSFVESPSSSPASTFTGWSGACGHTRATCNYTISGDVSLTATFTRVLFALSLSKTSLGGGRGTVEVAPTGYTTVSCGPACASGSWALDSGTSVTLTATADPANGSSFNGWGAGACSTAPGSTCTVTMSQAQSVVAIFAAPQAIDVTIEGTGSGGVQGGPIDCPATTCSAVLPYGTTFELVADWPSTSQFGGWTGASGCGLSPVCQVTLTNSLNVKASFNPPSRIITLSKSTDAQGATGTVTATTSDGRSQTCGTTCTSTTFSFFDGDVVTLTVSPSSDSYLVGWGSDCAPSGTGSTCALTLTANRSATVALAKPVLTLVKDLYGGGGGNVSSTNLRCGANCSVATATYLPGTRVTLTAAPKSGSSFVGWTGPCESYPSALECTVRMNSAKTINAAFAKSTTIAQLTVGVAGSGDVSSQPSGINGCASSTCVASFWIGAGITLVATPAAGQQFLRWTGGPCDGSTSPICSFTFASAVTVTANFGPAP